VKNCKKKKKKKNLNDKFNLIADAFFLMPCRKNVPIYTETFNGEGDKLKHQQVDSGKVYLEFS
jgi:hypothetical protein